MNSKRRIILILTFFCLFKVGYSEDKIVDLVKNAGSSKDYPKTNVLTIFDSTTVDVQETGLSYFYIHQLFKILTPKGAKDKSIIKFPYEPQSAFLQIRKVRIIRNSGETEDLDKNKIFDYPAPGTLILWGAREQMVEVGHLEVGDAVEVIMFKKGYTYALLQDDEDKYIPPMKGHYYDIVHFWTNEFTLEQVYRTIIPNEKKLQYEFYNGEVMPVVRLNGNKTIYTFTVKNISPFKKEPNMLGLSDIAPKLILTTSPDWEAKSRWFYGVNEDYKSFESTKEIKQKVNEILVGAIDEKDSISRLTHWVADEIRYLGLTMGEGEGYTLHTGEMTFRDRCGVCKDKAGMLVTMLRAAGFESYPAMTMAGSRIENIPADQFNHCVTAVRMSDRELHMLDPTWVPFVRELWSSLEQQQNYIVGTEEGEDLSIIPISSPKNHYYKIFGNSEIKNDGSLEGRFTLVAEGQSDASIRRSFTRNYRTTWDGVLEKELMNKYPNMEITNLEYSNAYDYSKPMMIKVNYKIPNFAIITANEIIFTPLVASNLFEKMNYHLRIKTNLKNRKYPFKDRCSKLIELTETITLPTYKKVIYLPEEIKSEGSGADFEGRYTFNGNNLKLYEKIVLKKRIYEVEDWASFRHTLVGQNKFANDKIILGL